MFHFLRIVSTVITRTGKEYGYVQETNKALCLAAEAGMHCVIPLLVTDGADASSCKALQLAAGSGHQNVFRLLLEMGADINAAANSKEETALHYAALGGQERLQNCIWRRELVWQQC